MSVHLSTPAAPKTAACGDVSAKRFTFWRWKSTCALCKAASAAVALETTRTTTLVYREDLPIRCSALVRYVRVTGGTDVAIAEFERERRIACSVCPGCKAELPDPIALLDVKANRFVFVCPRCADPGLRDRWEKEGET